MDRKSSDKILISLGKTTLIVGVFAAVFGAGSFFSGVFSNYLAYLNLPDSVKPIFFEQQKVPVSVQEANISSISSTSEGQKLLASGIAFGKLAPITEIQKDLKKPKVTADTYYSEVEEICEICDGETVSEDAETEPTDEVDCDCEGETAILDKAPPA